MPKFDFGGWATKNNIKCNDGKTILDNAFKHSDGAKVPMVWNHSHGDPTNILGYCILENRPTGVYAYGSFNDSEKGQLAKSLVKHGDLDSLSIFANNLQTNGSSVQYGDIREVSLVLAGANPAAHIDLVMSHSGESTNEAEMYMNEAIEVDITVADPLPEPEPENNTIAHKEDKKMPVTENTNETVEDVYNTLSEKQKTAVSFIVGTIVEAQSNEDEDEEGDTMKHSIFDTTNSEEFLKHSADIQAALLDGPNQGKLSASFIAHGITDIEFMFPDAQTVTDSPLIISRDMAWVDNVLSNTHHTPFSRIKSILADITEEDARARGYIKGKLKKEEVFSLLKRATTPTTIYKKQKLERDDVIDIKDMDIVAFLKSEMRLMLNEEIARATLVGDGRSGASDDKVNELCIRPIWKDEDLYTIKALLPTAVGATEAEVAKEFIKSCKRSRKLYKGSGAPSLYATEDIVTECLMLEDTTGRVIYDTVDKLATALRVKDIVTVPVMDNLSRLVGADTHGLLGIIVNLMDYTIGADKGGAVNMFDDFDIDFNAMKYLIETRCSGALIKPYSAIAVEYKIAALPAG